MKSKPPTHIRPSDGGRLVTAVAHNAVGLQNYVVKRNWRRDLIDEKRTEGHDYFLPYPAESAYQQYFTGAPSALLLTTHAERADGLSRVIAGDRQNLFQFDPATKSWLLIAGGKAVTGRRWECIRVGDVLVFNNAVDLPMTFRPGDVSAVPIYAMRDSGIVRVGTIAESNGILICGDITQIKVEEEASVYSALDYYGNIDAAKTERYQFRMAWSNVDDAKDWNQEVPGTVGSNLTRVRMKYRTRAFEAGQEILVQGAGAAGGNLVTTITAVEISPTTTTLVIDPPAVTQVTDNSVTLANAATNISAYDNLLDDSSAIVRIGDIQGFIVVYKESSSIYVGQYTGDTEAPFNMGRVYHEGDERERARAASAIAYRNTLVDTGEMHIYAGQNSFFYFDLVTRRPQIFVPWEDCRNLFFDNVAPADSDDVFAAYNPATSEAWLVNPNAPVDKVMRYDTRRKTASTSDESITCAGTIIHPDTGDTLFAMGTSEGVALIYGLSPTGLSQWENRKAIFWRRSAKVFTETRAPYLSEILPGHSGGGWHGMHLKRYMLDLSDKSPEDSWVQVQFITRRAQGQAGTIAGSRNFYYPHDQSALTCHIRAGFIQDRILCQAMDDLIIAGRWFELDLMEDHAFGRIARPGRDLTLGREDINIGREFPLGQTKTHP